MENQAGDQEAKDVIASCPGPNGAEGGLLRLGSSVTTTSQQPPAAPETDPGPRGSLHQVAGPLFHPNFRLLWLAPLRDLPNAIALNSSQFNLSRLLGPVSGAAVVLAVGTAACFALNGLSFFFVVAALAVIRIPPVSAAPRKSIIEELRSGLDYV